jgi:MSHA biogenesis protein MshM
VPPVPDEASAPIRAAEAEAPVSEPPVTTALDETVPVLQAEAVRPTTQEEVLDGDQLFRERQRASASWLAGAYRGGYTIQLMMLVSEQAQASVTRLLVDDDYRQILDHLYILSRKTTPPTLFVFYGIYESMDEAREARNSMPVFLRKHHPYPLSIAEALKKTEG